MGLLQVGKRKKGRGGKVHGRQVEGKSHGDGSRQRDGGLSLGIQRSLVRCLRELASYRRLKAATG